MRLLTAENRWLWARWCGVQAQRRVRAAAAARQHNLPRLRPT
jgi:hypothetical protein